MAAATRARTWIVATRGEPVTRNSSPKTGIRLQCLLKGGIVEMPCSHCLQVLQEKEAKLLMKLLTTPMGLIIKEIEPIKLRLPRTLP